MLTEIQIEELHEKYRGQFEHQGYRFVGSIDIHIPFLQMLAEYEYLGKCHMPIPEKVLCDCIRMGICRIDEISFVLSIDTKIVEKMTERLVQSNILYWEAETLQFTEEGKRLYQSNMRPVKEEESILVGYNLITGTWEGIQQADSLKKQEEIDGVKLEVKNSIMLEDTEQIANLRKTITEATQMSCCIENLSISKRRELVYQSRILLLYVNEEAKINHLVYDPRTEKLDFEISRYLQDSYSDQKLQEIQPIQDMLKREKEVIEEFGQPIQSIQYLQNREIREITKNIFQDAEKSIYIISPWLGTSDFVLTEEFLQQMEMALKQKQLQVNIMYGYVSEEKLERLIQKDRQEEEAYRLGKRRHYIKNREVQTKEAADELKLRFSQYKNFSITYRNTHEKVLCYDERYCLIGSYNYLSYDGGERSNYQGLNFRKEGAVFIEDEAFAKDLISRMVDQE